MTNSPLVDVTIISPNSSDRTVKIDKITIHHMAGPLTAEACGKVFLDPRRRASSNYGVDPNGRIGLYVPEDRRSWASSSTANDNRAVTIEVADSKQDGQWIPTSAAYDALIDLCVDICQRNGIDKLRWTGDAKGNLTVHRFFTATECPGDFLYGKMPDITHKVNAWLDKLRKEEEEVRYQTLKDITNKEFNTIIKKLINAGIINGDGKGNIDLSEDMVRTFVIAYRGGAFDKRLISEGMEPAVK